jgi:holo-[acyl-carrier protein] synthase
VDVQSIDEIASSLDEFGLRYTRRLFTSYEIEHCQTNPSTESRCFAGRFAAKEAVLKLLNVRDVIPPWKDIEVREDTTGRLEILLHGVAADVARQRGVRDISLDISHVRSAAIAVVTA